MRERIVFYEKPGCLGNKKQKKYLRDLGFELDVRNLLENIWSFSSLRPYFFQSEISEWFNASAPKIASGSIDTYSLNEAQALTLMLDSPILIRRPLLRFQGVCQSGFCFGPVFEVLNVIIDNEDSLENCPMKQSSENKLRSP